MFNRYLSEDREAFEDLYKPVSDDITENKEIISVVKKEEKIKKPGSGNLKKLFDKFNIGEIGLLPLILLLLLAVDAEDDEKLLIFALAIVLGI